MQSVAPSFLAKSNLLSFISIAIILDAFAILDPITADKPTPPRPNIATVSPFFIFAILVAAPIPVGDGALSADWKAVGGGNVSCVAGCSLSWILHLSDGAWSGAKSAVGANRPVSAPVWGIIDCGDASMKREYMAKLLGGLIALTMTLSSGVQAAEESEATLTLPPASIAQWYKPQNERQVWLHTMFGLRRSMTAIQEYVALEDGD